MSYLELTRQLAADPEQLELTYQQALAAGEADAFSEAVELAYGADSANLLYAAWHYRLAQMAATAARRVIAWKWAIPLAVLNGLLLWLLSDNNTFTVRVANPLTGVEYDILPVVALLAAPISAAVITLFLTLAGSRRWGRLAAVALGLAAAVVYVLLLFRMMWPRFFQEQYLTLMVMNLALLAWAGVGIVALAKGFGSDQRFAFLFKSLEALVVAGLFAVAGGIFMAITFGLFGALGINLPDAVARLFLAGGAGLIIVVAVALVYDPAAQPAEQSFDEGLSKLIALLLRLLLPLTVGVLLIYLAVIPFNFREPFENRDVLIVFNAMLFAVLILMMGATPVRGSDVSARGQTVAAARHHRAGVAGDFGQHLRAGSDRLSHHHRPADAQPADVHRLGHHQHRHSGAAFGQAVAGRTRALAAGHASHLCRRHRALRGLDGLWHRGAAVAVPRRPGAGGRPAGQNPAGGVRRAVPRAVEMRYQPAHLSAGRGRKALDQGYPHVRGARVSLERCDLRQLRRSGGGAGRRADSTGRRTASAAVAAGREREGPAVRSRTAGPDKATHTKNGGLVAM